MRNKNKDANDVESEPYATAVTDFFCDAEAAIVFQRRGHRIGLFRHKGQSILEHHLSLITTRGLHRIPSVVLGGLKNLGGRELVDRHGDDDESERDHHQSWTD